VRVFVGRTLAAEEHHHERLRSDPNPPQRAAQEAKVVALTPVGFPESSSLIRPVAKNERKTEGEVFSVNRFAPR